MSPNEMSEFISSFILPAFILVFSFLGLLEFSSTSSAERRESRVALPASGAEPRLRLRGITPVLRRRRDQQKQQRRRHHDDEEGYEVGRHGYFHCVIVPRSGA